MDQTLIDALTAPLRPRKPVSIARELDPLTLSTVWHGLQRICREMRRVIERTSQSYLISQLKDISVG
ncbi:MAG: hydantoinase B/oxoprolinase family protein, partial [Deltaproteobacteria bacterium]|nr:hydantoinase B/oxoprolinase family protein [Deltaproteobacteria bacterium]